MFSELTVVTVAVRDLDRSAGFYQRTFGYVVSDPADVQGPAVEAAWQMPAALRGRCVVLGPEGARTGLLRLVSFDSPGESIWGDYAQRQNYGPYALNIRVDDIDATLARLKSAGGQRRSGPTRWSPSADLDALDSLSVDPDGVMLDVFQVNAAPGSPLAAFTGPSSPVQTVALHVSDARKSADFYRALGYVELYDRLVENMEGFFSLPAGTALHNINLYMPSEPACGRVEIAQYVGFPGRQQRDRAVPPNTGILSATIETQDLREAAAVVGTLGGTPVCQPVELSLPPYGRVAVQPMFGPDGEVLEFIERR